MDFSKIGNILKYVIFGIVYIIIFIALIIMYKDMKNGNKRRIIKRKKSIGLEIINPGKNNTLKKGGVIPIHSSLFIGRKNDNTLVLNDRYVSAHHAKIAFDGNDYFIEDLGSTNGTYLNSQKIEDKISLKSGDEIEIGTSLFKVL